MGQEISKAITNKLNMSYNSNKTLLSFVPRSLVQETLTQLPSNEDLKIIIKNEKVRTKEDLFQRRLAIYSPRHWKCDYPLEKFIEEKSYLIADKSVF